MNQQSPLETWLSPSLIPQHHIHRPFHAISQLWKPDTKLSSAAQGAMWLELIDYSTLALLTLGLLISAIRLIALAINSRSYGNVQLKSETAETNSTLTRKEAFARSLIDNLDHGLGDDGDPLDLVGFWTSVSK